MSSNRLTTKQKVFVEEYLQCWNATEAARRASYAYPNVEGPKNLVKPSIKPFIKARVLELKMSADEILLRLADQARGDIGDFASIQHSTDLANHPLSRIVKKYKKRIYQPKDGDPYEEIELELYDAHAPLVDLGKAIGVLGKEIGSSEDKPFIVKVIKGVSIDDI